MLRCDPFIILLEYYYHKDSDTPQSTLSLPTMTMPLIVSHWIRIVRVKSKYLKFFKLRAYLINCHYFK